jgi:hypothetical protein
MLAVSVWEITLVLRYGVDVDQTSVRNVSFFRALVGVLIGMSVWVEGSLVNCSGGEVVVIDCTWG